MDRDTNRVLARSRPSPPLIKETTPIVGASWITATKLASPAIDLSASDSSATTPQRCPQCSSYELSATRLCPSGVRADYEHRSTRRQFEPAADFHPGCDPRNALSRHFGEPVAGIEILVGYRRFIRGDCRGVRRQAVNRSWPTAAGAAGADQPTPRSAGFRLVRVTWPQSDQRRSRCRCPRGATAALTRPATGRGFNRTTPSPR